MPATIGGPLRFSNSVVQFGVSVFADLILIDEGVLYSQGARRLIGKSAAFIFPCGPRVWATIFCRSRAVLWDADWLHHRDEQSHLIGNGLKSKNVPLFIGTTCSASRHSGFGCVRHLISPKIFEDLPASAA
jgi:hypothetical protein